MKKKPFTTTKKLLCSYSNHPATTGNLYNCFKETVKHYWAYDGGEINTLADYINKANRGIWVPLHAMFEDVLKLAFSVCIFWVIFSFHRYWYERTHLHS